MSVIVSQDAAISHDFHYSFLSPSSPGCHMMPLIPPGHGALGPLCAWHRAGLSGTVRGRVKGGKQSSTQCSARMIYWGGQGPQRVYQALIRTDSLWNGSLMCYTCLPGAFIWPLMSLREPETLLSAPQRGYIFCSTSCPHSTPPNSTFLAFVSVQECEDVVVEMGLKAFKKDAYLSNCSAYCYERRLVPPDLSEGRKGLKRRKKTTRRGLAGYTRHG